MSKKVPCGKCGVDNELTAVFCRSCGEKMDLHAVQADHFEHGGALSKEAIMRLLKILVLVGLVASLGLLLWPSSSDGAKGTNAGAKSARGKVVAITDAGKKNVEMQAELSEAEINGYLAAIVYQGKKRNQTISVGKAEIASINVDLGQSTAEVTVKGKLFGKVPVTYRVKGTPVVGPGSFQFNVKSGSVGHFPMIGPAAKFPAKQIEGALSGLRQERYVLDTASSMDLNDNGVTLYVEGK